MNTVVMLLGIVEIFICVICFFFKKRWQMLTCLLSYNSICLIQYALQGYNTELLIICVDIVKTIVFFIFAYKNLKPNLFVIIIFEAAVLTCAVLTWQNWFSLFLLFASMLGTFSYWQTNVLLIRIFACVSSLLVIANYSFTGLYVNIIAEAITFVAALVSIIIYRKELFGKDKNKADATIQSGFQPEQTEQE